ncbi:MAG: DegV family protein [Clostridiales bacterium]|nr:DegV family protein [Clostridiales bacterium]
MIRIITDSAADFSAGELRKHNLTAIPLQITFGTDAYEDGVTLTHEIFWTRIMSGENPKTSQPAPDAFLTAFEEAKAAGDSVVCILLSSGLSGTVQSANLAKSMADYDEIHIVDSLQAATAEKMLVLRACQLRDENKLSAAEIAGELRAFTKRIRLYGCLDTLDYLARGGRIPQAAASLGSLVQLKVLITLNEEGKVALAGKGMGLHRASAGVLKLIQQHKIDERFAPLPMYTYNPDNCLNFVKKLNQAGIACKGSDACAVGSTIGTHVGPGVFGLVFVEAE